MLSKFQSFWQKFTSAVHENEQITYSQKLTYLMNSLEGSAYKALEGLAITGENYQNAIETLKYRFGKKQFVVNAHMQELLKLNNAPNESVPQLRSIFDNLNVHVRGLEALGITSERYGSLLIPVVMSRMPSEIIRQVARKMNLDEWKISEILEVIRKEIDALEWSRKLELDTPAKTEKPRKQYSSPATTKAFVTKNDTNKTRKLQCFFCKKEHYSNQCTEVTDVKDRKAALMDENRCFNCLRRRNAVKICKSASKCYKCKGKHNTAICYKLEATAIAEKEPSHSIITATTKEKSSVLLQTAKAYVFGDDPCNKIPIHILLDSGSQRTYVAEEIKKNLQLKAEAVETINLNTFDTEKYSKKQCERVVLNLEVENEVVPVKALSFPQLCSPISRNVDISSYPHLQGLNLADSFTEGNRTVDLVLGKCLPSSFSERKVLF